MTRANEVPAEDTGRVFVGRKAELAELRTALERATAGRGSVVLVAGEPGIGKSELADRVAAEAAESGARVLWGRSWEGEGAPPYWPWAQIIRDHVRELSSAELESVLGPGAPYLGQIVPEIRERLPGLATPTPLDSEQARFRLFDSITTFFRAGAAEQPLVLVLDDLHWADKASLLLLQFLAREIGGARLLVVATYRDVEVSRGHPVAEVLPSLRRERTVERILLRGLPEQDVRTLLAALRGEKLPDALAHAISRETEGNPFFIQEIVRHLIEEGVLSGESAGWTSRTRLDEIGLPESVRDVIGRRLGRLSESCTKVLTVAAVLGREFDLDALERVAGLEKERLLEILDEAFTAQVVEEAPQRLGRYRFSHALIRESLYEELNPLERFRNHLRVAEVLEALHSRKPGPHLAELAHHFRSALPGGDVDKAIDYAMRAGDYASEQLAYEEAAIHHERALQALDLRAEPDDRLRAQLLLKHGEACWGAGLDATKSLEDAAELAERVNDAEILARAALGRAGFLTGIYVMVGESVPGTLLRKAFAAFDDRDSALKAQVMSRLSALQVFMNIRDGEGPDPVPNNVSLAHASLAMARRVGDKATIAYVLASTMWAACGLDDLEDRFVRYEEVARLAEESGDARLAAEGHLWLASGYLEVGDIAAADRELEIQERYASDSRQAYHLYLAACARGSRAFNEGRFDEAEEALQSAYAMGARNNPNFVGAVSGSLNQIYEQQGRVSEDLPALVRMAAQYPRVPLYHVGVAVRRATDGHMAEARRDYQTIVALGFSQVPRDMLWLFNMSRISELVLLFGNTEQAATLYDLLYPYRDRCVVISSIGSTRGGIARSLGCLAIMLSRYDDAERHFEQALEINTRMRARIWTAHTQHDYARMLVARDRPGDREKATALSAEALAAAREIGMKPLEAKVTELRAASGFADRESVAPTSEAQPKTTTPSVFRKDGDFWTISYESKALRLKDAKGLQYIAHLIRNEGREVHAADLAAGGEERIDRGDAGEVLDAQARIEYRQRITDLEAELDEATRWGDAGRAARTREEIEFLKDELSAAFGLGGRSRRSGSADERARKAVASRMQETIGKIRKEHPVLALHLANSIRTGSFCCYQPDRTLRWEL